MNYPQTGISRVSASSESRGRTNLVAGRLGRYARRTPAIVLRWAVLLGFVYVFLYPILFMFTTSFKSLEDLNDPSIRWISPHPSLEGYRLAFDTLEYLPSVLNSLLTSGLAALGQMLVGAMVAYGFSRLGFPGSNALFALLVLTIVVPLQTTMIPQFILYSRLGWMNTLIPLIAPAFLGYGVRGGILLIVYHQFFKGLPYELEDAASVDGAGPLRTFWQIMLPLAKPAMLVVMLFSLVWTWNDTFVPSMVIRDERLYTLPQRMSLFTSILNTPNSPVHLEENLLMAAVILTVAPMLMLYLFAQRYFIQSIDRTGLVE